MKAFGIGCFHFGITRKMQSPFSAREYATEIETALKAIANISEIDVFCDDPVDSTEQKFEHNGDIPVFSDGDDWFPYVSFLDISFDVYLPRRVQAEVLETPEEFLKTQSERFHVLMRNCYYSPVTFITLLEAQTDECNASDAVVLMRRYIEKEIQKQDGKLKLEFTGPSPFHADFFLRLKPGINHTVFDFSLERKRGYDKLIFFGEEVQFQDDNAALDKLIDELDDELALYYSIIRSRCSCYSAWERVDSQVSDIMRSEQKKGMCTRLHRACTQGHKLSVLVDDICEFRSLLISDRQMIEEAYRNTYASGGYLKPYIDDVFNNPPQFPVIEVSELVRFREQRHSRFWEIFAVLSSAILGGLVGSLVTYFLTTASMHPDNTHVFNQESETTVQERIVTDTKAQQIKD